MVSRQLTPARGLEAAGALLDEEQRSRDGTTATLFARAKVHSSVEQKILRHADIETTLAIYMHVGGIEDMRAAVAMLDFGPFSQKVRPPTA